MSNLSVRLNGKIYSKTAILSATYRYSGLFFISIENDNDTWIVKFSPRKPEVKVSEESLDHFENEVMDYELRRELEESFKPLREMIVSKAFDK
jgi:His-Xaa-Ser system protein HxsD